MLFSTMNIECFISLNEGGFQTIFTNTYLNLLHKPSLIIFVVFLRKFFIRYLILGMMVALLN